MGFKQTVKIVAILSGITMLTIGLIAYYKQQVEKALEYCYKIISGSVNEITRKKINVTLYIKLMNNSNFSVIINNYEIDIYINNKYVVKVKSDKKQLLKANGVSTLEVPIIFVPSKIFSQTEILTLIGYGISKQDKFIIQLKGKFTASMQFITVKMPIDTKFTLAELLAPSDKPKAECKIT
jgi:LEA14-like dessication related protein